MRLLTVYRTTILLAAFAILDGVPSSAQPKATLPFVTSYSLDKARVTLPEDLAGQHNVLILYFEPYQSEGAVAWATALQPARSTHQDLQSYILPVYPRENILYRWWIGASLRSSAPPAQEWRSTIPIFVDKNKFLPALAITDEKQFVVLLTDRAGHVDWRAEGTLTDTKMASLLAAINIQTASLTRVTGAHTSGH